MQAHAHRLAEEVVVAITTLAADADAAAFARTLVERELIACANVLPGVTSIYRWKGEVVADGEQLVVMKLPGERLDALKQAFAELHPYEVPELLVFDVRDGLEAYLRWVVG